MIKSPNFTLFIAIAIGAVLIPYRVNTESFAAPISSSTKPSKTTVNTVNKVDKTVECKAFTTITDKASGAKNTMDLAVALRYTNDLKQDLLALKVEDSQLKSLQERYLLFAGDMGEKLARVKRDQAQGDYSALLVAMPTLKATGNRGFDLEQKLWQYCGKA